MNSVILQLADKYVRWLLFIFAAIALVRGHNLPGGGFIGGMLAGLSIVYKGFAYDPEQVRDRMQVSPFKMIGYGLIIVLASLVPSVVMQLPLMTGVWVSVNLPWVGLLKLGTPFLFDVGVFLTVIGVTLLFLFTLKKQSTWK